MSRGIYITANDRVTDHAIALLNSIRQYDPETPVMLIPYDDHYHEVAATLLQMFGVQVYPDLNFIDRLSLRLHESFGDRFFARPNQFRKQACWFGPFEQFLYIDTDIVVFEKIIDSLNYLQEADFVCNDYQHIGGITNVFTAQVLEQGVFTPAECQEIFNGGFWGSSKGLISEDELYATFAECAAHPDYFDFSQKTSDQPILNYMVLKRIARRCNIARQPQKAPGNWAGSPHFVQRGDRLWDSRVDQPLHYLHWAGIKIQPGCPYWEIWQHYRYLHQPQLVQTAQTTGAMQTLQPQKTRTIWRRTVDKILAKFADSIP
jgi:hypothetical protein